MQMEVLHVLRAYLTKHVLLSTQLPHGISVIRGRERGQLSEVNSLKKIKIVFWNFFFSFYVFLSLSLPFHHFLLFPLRILPAIKTTENHGSIHANGGKARSSLGIRARRI